MCRAGCNSGRGKPIQVMPSGFLKGDRKNLEETGVSTLSPESRAQQGAGSAGQAQPTLTTGCSPVGLSRPEPDSFTL